MATLQGELELLKEFRSSKAALDKEIADLKETIQQMELNYKKTSSRMQERFLEEKVSQRDITSTVCVRVVGVFVYHIRTYVCNIHTSVHFYK